MADVVVSGQLGVFCTQDFVSMIKANTSLDMKEVFAPKGVVAGFFADFECRPQQIEMAVGVREAINEGRRLVA